MPPVRISCRTGVQSHSDSNTTDLPQIVVLQVRHVAALSWARLLGAAREMACVLAP